MPSLGQVTPTSCFFPDSDVVCQPFPFVSKSTFSRPTARHPCVWQAFQVPREMEGTYRAAVKAADWILVHMFLRNQLLAAFPTFLQPGSGSLLLSIPPSFPTFTPLPSFALSSLSSSSQKQKLNSSHFLLWGNSTFSRPERSSWLQGSPLPSREWAETF